jgi:type IV pili sensor histidine kinase/response regulator
MRPFTRFHCVLVHALWVAALLSAGCASTPRPSHPNAPTIQAASAPIPERVPVTRAGRYTLIELAPEAGQRDLLQQPVEIAIPSVFDATVGAALRHVLLRSGYRLCDSAEATTLFGLPLPAAHLRLGPLTLRDALLTLIGPAWDMSVNEANRQVCFHRTIQHALDMRAEEATP